MSKDATYVVRLTDEERATLELLVGDRRTAAEQIVEGLGNHC